MVTMKVILPAVLVLLQAWPLAAAEAPGHGSEVREIRNEMERLRRDYEQRLRALEERLQRIEAAAPEPETNSAQAPAGAPPAAQPSADKPVSAPSPAIATLLSRTNTTEFSTTSRPRVRGGPLSFRSATESRQRAIAARQDAALKERVERVLEGFVDIGGYFRAGYGVNDNGGPQVAFQAPGAFSKYRLGNEAEIYGELSFSKDFYLPKLFSLDPNERPGVSATGPVAHVQARLSAYNPYQDLLTASGTDFGLPEAWASIGNVLPTQPNLKAWAGTRFYRRHDIHISDFYFYNMSGAGGGLEDFELPFGKAAVAWIGSGASSGFTDVPQPDPENRAGFSKDNLDLRLYDVPVPLGKGEFGVVLARATTGRDAAGNSVADTQGAALTALHTRENFISEDGYNKLSLQFGTGPAKTFTSGFETVSLTNGLFIRPDAENSWRFRATEHFVANFSQRFSISPALVYQITDQGDDGGMVHWASAGVRPILHFNRHFSLAFEGGVDWVRDEDARASGYVTKLTLAPQVSLGNRFLSRPVIRAFATHAFWSDDFVGKVGGVDYINDDNGWTYGVQMEVWW